MKKYIVLMMVAGLAFLLNSCKKTADRPPLEIQYSRNYSVAELKAIASCTGSCVKRFTDDVYFTGVVIADHVSGNFYKELYVRDRYNGGAIRLDLKASSYYIFIGDSVRLSLKGYDVSIVDNMLQIDSVDNEKHLRVFASGANPQPIDVDLFCTSYANYYCELVRLNNVAFLGAHANQIYADAISQTSLNRVMEHAGGKQITVRTSNYASFAMEKTPTGSGSITGIVTAYGTTDQMVIRKTSEVNMNGPALSSNHKKDFNDNSITSSGWTQQSVTDPGTQWTASTYNGAIFAKISAYYASTNHVSENWLISPPVDLSASSNPVLTFQTAAKFSGNALEVLVSTTYTSGTPNPLDWISLGGFNLSPSSGNYIWTPSCYIPLSAYKSTNTRVAFKYTSTASASTTYELDDIIIREK